MKRYLLGLTALVMAIGTSAFTAPPKKSKKDFELYWFVVKPGWGIASGFTNNMVTYLATSEYVPTGICTVFPWTYKCVVGFDFTDVNPATNALYSGYRYPVAIGEKRPTM